MSRMARSQTKSQLRERSNTCTGPALHDRGLNTHFSHSPQKINQGWQLHWAQEEKQVGYGELGTKNNTGECILKVLPIYCNVQLYNAKTQMRAVAWGAECKILKQPYKQYPRTMDSSSFCRCTCGINNMHHKTHIKPVIENCTTSLLFIRLFHCEMRNPSRNIIFTSYVTYLTVTLIFTDDTI